jgi:hypothetical protein
MPGATPGELVSRPTTADTPRRAFGSLTKEIVPRDFLPKRERRRTALNGGERQWTPVN